MKARLISLFSLLTLAGITHAQKVYTLRECIDSAIANNYTVLQTELLADRAASNYKQSRYNRLPSVNAGFFYGGSRGRSIDPFTNSFVDQAFTNSNTQLNASLPLFAGGQIHNSIEQMKALYDAGKFDLQQAKANLTMNVIASYLLVLSGEDQVNIAQQQLGVSNEQVRRLQIVADEGATAPYTLTDLKAEYAMNRASLVQANNNKQQAKISLARLMNIEYDSSMMLSREGLIVTPEQTALTAELVYNDALNFMGMVKAAEARSKAADYAIKVARGQLYPTLSLNGGLGTNYSSAAQRFSIVDESFGPTDSYVVVNGVQTPLFVKQQQTRIEPFGFARQYNNNLNSQFGLNMQIPIFNNYVVRNRITQAKIDKRNAEAFIENTSNQLQQDVWQAWQNMQASYERYTAFTDQANALKASFEAANVRFENGVINSAEYLLIKNNYDRAVVNLTQAQYEFMMRSRILDFYRGKL